jgi:eukaryotic-like serine/threonine-protein kinase
MDALLLSKSRDVEFAAALSFSTAGDLAMPQSLIGDLERRFAEETSVRFSYLPAIRGTPSLVRGRSSEAIETPQTSAPTELATPAIASFSYFGSLYRIRPR